MQLGLGFEFKAEVLALGYEGKAKAKSFDLKAKAKAKAYTSLFRSAENIPLLVKLVMEFWIGKVKVNKVILLNIAYRHCLLILLYWQWLFAEHVQGKQKTIFFNDEHNAMTMITCVNRSLIIKVRWR